MGKIKNSPRHNVISVRVTDEEMMVLNYLRKLRKTTYTQLVREALAVAGFPSCVDTEGDKTLPYYSG